jgi:hypothetical protein
MKISTADLTQDRQWRAMIGMSEQQFYSLSDAFTKAYFNTCPLPTNFNLISL